LDVNIEASGVVSVSLVAIALRVVAMSANEDLEEEILLLVVARRLSSLEAVLERVETVSEWLEVRFFRSIVVVACWMMLASRKVLEEMRLVHVSVRRVDTLLATVLVRSEERSSMDSSTMRKAMAVIEQLFNNYFLFGPCLLLFGFLVNIIKGNNMNLTSFHFIFVCPCLPISYLLSLISYLLSHISLSSYLWLTSYWLISLG